MIFLSFGTGIRSGEMVSLNWSDIDFINRTISINKTIRKGRIKGTKTYSGKRVIDMNEETYQLLQNQKELLKEQDSEFVFLTYQNKNYTNPPQVSRGVWKTYLKFCKIKYRRFYNLRFVMCVTKKVLNMKSLNHIQQLLYSISTSNCLNKNWQKNEQFLLSSDVCNEYQEKHLRGGILHQPIFYFI